MKTLDGFIVADLVDLKAVKPLATASNITGFDSAELCRMGTESFNIINEAVDLVNAPYITFVHVTNPV